MSEGVIIDARTVVDVVVSTICISETCDDICVFFPHSACL